MRLRAVVAGLFVAIATATAVLATSREADAKATYESPYGFDRTWNAGFRLVRVDLGLKVTEKDQSVGYIMFDYKSPESSKPCPGSLELIRNQDDSIQVIVQIPQMPGYHEQVMVDALARKMRVEYGDPPKKPPPPSAPRDAGADADPGAGETPDISSSP